MQKIIISGYLGRDAEVKDLGSTQVINFSVGCTRKVKEEKVTTWYKCAKFTNNVAIAPFLKKGTGVIVEGIPELESYLDKDQKTVTIISIRVENIHFVGGSSENKTDTPTPQERPQANMNNSFVDGEPENDLPF